MRMSRLRLALACLMEVHEPMRRFGIFGGLSVAFLVGACAIGTVGCEGSDTSDVGEVTSSPEARAIEHVRLDPSRAFVDGNHDFQVRHVVKDLDGREHVHLDRMYKGLRVVGGDFIVHGRVDGTFDGVTQTLRRGFDVDTSEAMSKQVAIEIAQGEQTALPVETAPKAELVVHARGERPVLAYEVVAYGMKEDQTPSELHVFVDAATGDVLESFEGIETAAGTGKGYFTGNVALTTNLNGTKYELKDPSRGNTFTTDMATKQSGNGTLMTDTDNAWGDGLATTVQTIGVDAQFGTAVTWDYYLNVHGRNGIANNGVGASNHVNYGRKYNNAFWSDSCFCMTYGNGDGATFNPFDSLDVAGHEMSHGVTSKTANLTYSGESGGLNEATSDIFGTMVEYYANNAVDTPDYKIGEMLYKSNATGSKALRFMYNPDADGVSKGCYVSTLGSLDVHYSSGVANHFFYLLAEGSSSTLTNTCSTGLSVTGIGRSAAEKIWYRALTVYMTASTNYAGARVATLNAANDLFGAGSSQSTAVATAWSAVKVN